MKNLSTLFLTLVVAALLMAACGGSSESGGSTNDPAPPATNNPPTISGAPILFVTRDQSYEFTPTASDPDGDELTFSIINQPTWAMFNTSTGTLSGTPGESDIGTSLAVTISVSDGDLSASLGPFDLEVRQVPLGSATVSWNIPTTNADSSPITDLAGFRVHYGKATQDYTAVLKINDPDAVSALIEDLEPGTWFFAVTAFDYNDNQSEFSAEVSKVVQP